MATIVFYFPYYGSQRGPSTVCSSWSSCLLRFVKFSPILTWIPSDTSSWVVCFPSLTDSPVTISFHYLQNDKDSVHSPIFLHKLQCYHFDLSVVLNSFCCNKILLTITSVSLFWVWLSIVWWMRPNDCFQTCFHNHLFCSGSISHYWNWNWTNIAISDQSNKTNDFGKSNLQVQITQISFKNGRLK